MLHSPSSLVYWYKERDSRAGEALFGEERAEVAVVGGGMAGLMCAQKLYEAGIDVVVVEKDFCGAGASGKTSGFITPDSETELSTLVKQYGVEEAKRIWEFVVSGVDHIRWNIQRYGIDADYVPQDSLFVANDVAGFRRVSEEHSARQQLGYESVLYDEVSIQTILGSTSFVGGVQYSETFGMNSYAYCLAMRDVLRGKGVRIYEGTMVEKIEGNVIVTSAGKVIAEKIVVCTDRFVPEMGVFSKEIYHVQTFLGITKPLSDDVIATMFPEKKMMVWDTSLVYNYFRVTGENRLLIGGGDLLHTYMRDAVTDVGRYEKRLRRYIEQKFPDIAIELEYVWSGMLGVSKDLLPVMGVDPNNDRAWYVGAATGLPWADALGRYAAERIIDGRCDFDETFSPNRHFIIGPRIQSLLTTPVTYAVSHGIAKLL